MKANDGRYIVIAVKGFVQKEQIVEVRMNEIDAVKFRKDFRASIVINGATGAIVHMWGSISEKMWDVVEACRKRLRNR